MGVYVSQSQKMEQQLDWDAAMRDVKERCKEFLSREYTHGEIAQMWRDLKEEVNEVLTEEQQKLHPKMRSLYTSGQPLTEEQKEAESIFKYLMEKHMCFWALHPHWYNATISGQITSSQIERLLTLKVLMDSGAITDQQARREMKLINRSK